MVPLVSVLLLGLILRLIGINWALPYVPHPDERKVVEVALGYVVTGDWRPPDYQLPVSLLRYSVAGLFIGLAAVMRLTGAAPDLAALERWYWDDPSVFYILGRSLSVAFAMATIALVYRFGARAWSRAVGLLSALFLAVSPMHVEHSHYLSADVPVTFFALLTAYAAYRLAESGHLRYSLLAGAALGMALATKYTAAALVVLPLLGQGIWAATASQSDDTPTPPRGGGLLGMALGGVALLAVALGAVRLAQLATQGDIVLPATLMKIGRVAVGLGGALLIGFATLSWRSPAQAAWVWRAALGLLTWRTAVAPVAMLVVFLACTPFFLPQFGKALQDIAAEFALNDAGFVGGNRLPGLANYWWYLQEPLASGLGVSVAVLAILGTARLIRRRRPADTMILGAAGLLWLLVGSLGLRWARWILPIVPFATLAAGVGASWLSEALATRRRQWWPALATSLLALVLLLPLATSAQVGPHLAHETNQRRATEWILANLPPGSKIAYEMTSIAPHIPASSDLALPRPGWPFTFRRMIAVADESYDAYQTNGFDYLILSDEIAHQLAEDPIRYATQRAFYDRVAASATLVQTFTPTDPDFWDPTIRVYALR